MIIGDDTILLLQLLLMTMFVTSAIIAAPAFLVFSLVLHIASCAHAAKGTRWTLVAS
jgi:hypothetical protein